MNRIISLVLLACIPCFGQSVMGGGAKAGGAATNYASGGNTTLTIATQPGSGGAAFGNQPHGAVSPALLFIVTNTGTLTATGVSQSFTGTNAADFATQSYSGVIADPLNYAAQAQYLISSYSESGTTMSITLTSAHNFQANQKVHIILGVGNGGNAVARVTPTGSTTFTYTAPVSGLGSGSCTQTSWPNCTVVSMAYAPCGSTIAAGATCYVAAQFTPSGTSAESATLNVTSSNASTVTEALTGTGVSATAVSSCGTLSGVGTYYYLTQTIASTGTCETISAAIGGLNLNNFSIQYGSTTTTGSAVYGIEITGALASSISNGYIVQENCLNPDGTYAGSSDIDIQGDFGKVDGAAIFDISTSHCSENSKALDMDFDNSSSGFGGVNAYNWTETPNVVTSTHRDYFTGYSFGCDNCGNHTVEAYFHDIFDAGVNPQGCFAWNNKVADKYNNYCAVGNPTGTTASGGTAKSCTYNPWTNAAGTTPTNAGTSCANDFAVGNGDQDLFENFVVNSQQGRGIFVGGGSPTTAEYNTVYSSIEYANNYEYNGCEPEGTYGIQFDNNETSQLAQFNLVHAWAGVCVAAALKLTDSETYTNISNGNTYYAHRPTGSASNCNENDVTNGTGNCAIGLYTYGPTGFLSENDVFYADNYCFFWGWSPTTPTNVTLLSPTCNKGSNPDTSWYYASAQTGGTANSGAAYAHIRDPIFGAGVSFTNTDFQAQNSGSYGIVVMYEDFTQTVNVVKTSGPAATGATVTYTDSHSNSYICTTVLNGSTSTCIPLNNSNPYPNPPTSISMNNNGGANQEDNGFNPYTISVSLSGCTTFTQSSVTISATGTKNVTLAGC